METVLAPNKRRTKVVIATIIVIGISMFALAISLRSNQSNATSSGTENSVDEKIYVALEGEGKVAVVDPAISKVISTIDLSAQENGLTVRYMAHNIQVAPNGKIVLVTANVEEGMEMDNDVMPDGSQMPHGQTFDQLIVIDPLSDRIVRRIPIEIDSHLAHVVLSPDSKVAFVTLQEKGEVYSIDIEDGRIIYKIDLGEKSGPHGLRMTPDGSEAFIALLDGKGVAVLDTKTNSVRKLELPGAVVQAAVTPDGTYAFASVYDTKQIAWFDRLDGERGLLSLPSGSRGPVQIYPTPDSRYRYVADQGYYFDQPTGSVVYRVDVASKVIDQTIVAGSAPHGVVVNSRGTRVYVTNLLSDDVSVIDTATGKETARVTVGDMPNGVSIWNREMGETP